MKEKFWAFLVENKRVIAWIVAILIAYALSKSPGLEAEKDLLEMVCLALGIGGTGFVRSFGQKKAPPQ